MKSLLLLAVLAVPQLGAAQDSDSTCATNLEAQFRSTGVTSLGLQGSGLYIAYSKAVVKQNSDLIMGPGLYELSVPEDLIQLDDELVKLQRQRLSMVRNFVISNRAQMLNGDNCAVAAEFPAVLNQIKIINDAYVARFNSIIQERLAELLRK